MSRKGAIRRIGKYFESDGFFDDLARRVAIHTQSQEPDRRPELYRYLSDEMQPYLEPLGFAEKLRVWIAPAPRAGPSRELRGQAPHPAKPGGTFSYGMTGWSKYFC